MPVAGGGFEQCYNAQAVVATESLLVIATDVVQAPNDKQQIAPMLEKVDALPEQLGRPETLLADNGYFSEANVMACTAANIEPLIATGRQPHHPSWRERFAAPPPAPENPTAVEAMAWRLRTPQGKQLYGLRKQTPEPVFGIIKSVMGFRQFLLRGLDCVRGEWSLVTMAWHIEINPQSDRLLAELHVVQHLETFPHVHDPELARSPTVFGTHSRGHLGRFLTDFLFAP